MQYKLHPEMSFRPFLAYFAAVVSLHDFFVKQDAKMAEKCYNSR